MRRSAGIMMVRKYLVLVAVLMGWKQIVGMRDKIVVVLVVVGMEQLGELGR